MGVTLGVGLVFSYFFSLPTARDVERALAGRAADAPRGGGWIDQPVRGGGKIRMWAIFTTYRVLGKSFTKFVCVFIILCVYPWAKPVRMALRKFLEAARRRFSQSCEDFRLSEAARRRFPQSSGCIISPLHHYTISPFRIMLNFAWAMVDKIDACGLMKSPPKMTVCGDRGWTKGGCFLLSTHIGCIEVLPALAES
jgi:predicted LPLAT superfamily acyltransferase